LFFVVFSYVSKAALKMGRKLEDEEEVMGAALDIGLVGKTRTGPLPRALRRYVCVDGK
jgi:hypothetical protein